MKIGFVSAILDGWTFEEMMETAAGMGYQCVEAACWPDGKAERRYAGVSHIDVDNTSHGYVEHIKEISSRTGVAISALAYYPNTMDSNLEKREAAIAHLKKVICFSQKLGVGLVTTFIGREQTKSVEENLETFRQVWPPIIRYAEEHDVKIAVENCPMLFGPEQWPGGQNLFTTPALWRTLFDIRPSRNFGINYDPSHLVWQGVNELTFLRDFADRIYHVHIKDVKINKNERAGILGSHLEFGDPRRKWNFVSVGHGDVDFDGIIRELNFINYDGPLSVEWEDSGMEREFGAKEAFAYISKMNFSPSQIAFDSALKRE